MHEGNQASNDKRGMIACGLMQPHARRLKQIDCVRAVDAARTPLYVDESEDCYFGNAGVPPQDQRYIVDYIMARGHPPATEGRFGGTFLLGFESRGATTIEHRTVQPPWTSWRSKSKSLVVSANVGLELHSILFVTDKKSIELWREVGDKIDQHFSSEATWTKFWVTERRIWQTFWKPMQGMTMWTFMFQFAKVMCPQCSWRDGLSHHNEYVQWTSQRHKLTHWRWNGTSGRRIETKEIKLQKRILCHSIQ